MLTAAAAMIGAAFIITDPIFQGLAISLVFGLASSTALTVLVIPAVYVWLRDDGRDSARAAQAVELVRSSLRESRSGGLSSVVAAERNHLNLLFRAAA